jgi:hypothetical protein
MRRFGIRPAEQAKLHVFANREVDDLARRRSLQRDRDEARTSAARQALREALQRA